MYIGTPHFTRSEYERSDIAIVRGILNVIPLQFESNAQFVLETLESIRMYLGSALYISSGYRSLLVNKYVGSSRKSQHMKAQAADIYSRDRTRAEVAAAIEVGDFDQLITYDYGDSIMRSMVHVSVVQSGNRRERLHSPSPGVYNVIS